MTDICVELGRILRVQLRLLYTVGREKHAHPMQTLYSLREGFGRSVVKYEEQETVETAAGESFPCYIARLGDVFRVK